MEVPGYERTRVNKNEYPGTNDISYKIILYNNIYSMTGVTFNDILQYRIISNSYEVILPRINTKDLKVFKQALKELLSFVSEIKSYITNEKLKYLIRYQEKLAQKLLFVIRIRYIIFFLYNTIVRSLTLKLYESIREFINEIGKIIKY
ncbi:MAG: hypothetical protein QXE55_08115 [Saccharolobus sp.]